MLDEKISSRGTRGLADMQLDDGSRVAVIGAGPAGSMFSYFLLDLGERIGLDVKVDIYEPRDFSRPGPAGCNMCGGIVSESLVQALALEGINLPPSVVQRGIGSYVLHMDEGSVRIELSLQEERIAVVHRGAGPRGIQETKWQSFDGYLLGLAEAKGAAIVPGRVDEIKWRNGRPTVKTRDGVHRGYDLLVAAVGVNTASTKLFEGLGLKYRPPRTTTTHIREFCLGRQELDRLGNSIHIFLLNLPRLEFAALIPKDEYLTLCLLGQDIDGPLVASFLDAPEVRQCLPEGWQAPEKFCRCSPRMNVRAAVAPFADRMVFIGDCGVTRLYKDGIGAAYRTAKAAASTAALKGVSGEHFRRHFWPVCRAIRTDNRIGKVIFTGIRKVQKLKYTRIGILGMTAKEQVNAGGGRRMSMTLWDMFTGSSPYRDILVRSLHPGFLGSMVWNVATAILPTKKKTFERKTQ